MISRRHVSVSVFFFVGVVVGQRGQNEVVSVLSSSVSSLPRVLATAFTGIAPRKWLLPLWLNLRTNKAIILAIRFPGGAAAGLRVVDPEEACREVRSAQTKVKNVAVFLGPLPSPPLRPVANCLLWMNN